MKDTTSTFARIIKTDKNPDGTLTVYGKATDDSLDIDQQIADAAWLGRAMPEWFMTGGNIREQHSSIAAGVAKEYEAKADGHYISALVVDPVSVKKVETGVLKGFSIGIRAPRVVRDNKAVNGRIVDGQIVEVSLVDRPANPNCQLVLAKTVKGKRKLVKVEEMVKDATPSVAEVISIPKSVVADILKFDKAKFEAARDALADLIAVEAEEMKEGHNEVYSITHLLEAVSHLVMWYEGEEREGEVAEEVEEIEMSAKADEEEKPAEAPAEEEKADDATCPECGEEMKMCKCNKEEKELVMDGGQGEPDVVAEKSITEIIPPSHIETLPTVTEETIEEFTEDDSVSKTLLANLNLNEIVENAVKSAMKSVESEIAMLKSAKEAVEEKAVTLETELATAKSLALGGGPKRTSMATGTLNKSNELIAKADYYLAKSVSVTDKKLADGYREMARDFREQAETLGK